MRYLKEAKTIWRDFVPPSGQADTVHGELLRAVEKLRDEATRNGNMNWDEGFVTLWAYLERHLLDSAVYSATTIRDTKAVLDRLRDSDDPYLGDDAYDLLSDRVVEYFKHYGSIPHEHNPRLRR